MSNADLTNRSWVIAKALRGKYSTSHLRIEARGIPEPVPGRVIVKTHLISIDPTTRNWLTLDPAKLYFPLAVGDPMVGVCVGRVYSSQHPDFEEGDLVSGMWNWQEYAVADPAFIEKHAHSDIPDEAYISVFSHVGRAAMMGLYEVGELTPDDVVLVSGAAGATGALAVQIAKAAGCRVVGIAGSPEKCDVVREMGADAAIDASGGDIGDALSEYCPDGVDVFFDNIGGATLDAVLLHMAIGCRIVVCGAMSQYDVESSSDQYGVKNLQLLVFRQARMRGFVVPQFLAKQALYDNQLRELWSEGKIRARAHVVDGFEQAAEAISINLERRNHGKVMVRVAAP